MSLADELVILVVELQWCMKLGPYFYSGGHFVSRLNSFPKYSPTALHLGTDTAPRRHILVVDDSCISAQLVQYNLEQSGFETSTASDGREAWMKAQEQQFDLILTDEHMPSMNGTELCQLLRSHDLYRETPIVLFTTTGKLANISELREELNIAATVYKSFKPADLLRAIEFAFRVPVALPT
jgi:CheY-like chemotaxis protein